MDSILRIIVLHALLATTLAAEDDAPQRVPAATGIPGAVTGGRFVPPLPAPPPKEIPAEMRVEAAVVKELPGGKALTLIRGGPSTLPDIPVPVAPPPLTAEQLAVREAFRAARPRPVQLQMVATVFDHRVSHVRWSHPVDRSTVYEAVVGLDFGLFSSAGNFLHDGVPQSLFLLLTELDTTGIRRLLPWHGQVLRSPVPAEGFLILKGDPHDAVGTAPLVKLMDLYGMEKERLLQARVERRQAQLEAAEWRRLHPPSEEPVSHAFWLRPHRGSRYAEDQAKGGNR